MCVYVYVSTTGYLWLYKVTCDDIVLLIQDPTCVGRPATSPSAVEVAWKSIGHWEDGISIL